VKKTGDRKRQTGARLGAWKESRLGRSGNAKISYFFKRSWAGTTRPAHRAILLLDGNFPDHGPLVFSTPTAPSPSRWWRFCQLCLRFLSLSKAKIKGLQADWVCSRCGSHCGSYPHRNCHSGAGGGNLGSCSTLTTKLRTPPSHRVTLF
jgi:hypothetical protein